MSTPHSNSNFQLSRFSTPSYYARRKLISSLCSNAFPYSRSLVGAHSSCINALAFSNGDGRFLASGGDDLNIKLWDFHQEDVMKPSLTFVGPSANIFNLAFSASNRFLFSGGADDDVQKYDLERLDITATRTTSNRSADVVYRDHEGSIRAISPHPYHDEIFLTGSEDGRVIIHDEREPRFATTRAQSILQLDSEVTGLQYHPQLENLFVTCDSQGSVYLRDTRMAFGPAKSRSQQGIVTTYASKIAEGYRFANPEASSLCFNKTGSIFAVTFQYYLPTLYMPSDPLPIATCSGQRLSSGLAAGANDGIYSNSCTMKHGCFGGPGLEEDIYYCAGSDDFRGYIWNLQLASQLKECREEQVSNDGRIAFLDPDNSRRYIPLNLDSPQRLAGHRSIVNQIVMHPTLPYIATAGIESSILLHCAKTACSSTANLPLTPTEVRSVGKEDPRSLRDRLIYFRALHGLPAGDFDVTEDDRTIAMFDHILRQEGDTDPFIIRPWRGNDDEEDDTDSDQDF